MPSGSTICGSASGSPVRSARLRTAKSVYLNTPSNSRLAAMPTASRLSRSPGRRYATDNNTMLHGRRVAVVMPAYRAEKTLEECFRAIPSDIVDFVLLVDDASDDATLAVAKRLGITAYRHPENRGYGANQKT